jgi:hypothetical protein
MESRKSEIAKDGCFESAEQMWVSEFDPTKINASVVHTQDVLI